MKRVKDRFALTAPMQTPTDNIAAENVAGALTGLRAKGFVDRAARRLCAHAENSLASTSRSTWCASPRKDEQAYTLRSVHRHARGRPRATSSWPTPAGRCLEMGSDWAQKKLSTPLNQLRDKHVVATVRDSVRRNRHQPRR